MSQIRKIPQDFSRHVLYLAFFLFSFFILLNFLACASQSSISQNPQEPPSVSPQNETPDEQLTQKEKETMNDQETSEGSGNSHIFFQLKAHQFQNNDQELFQLIWF